MSFSGLKQMLSRTPTVLTTMNALRWTFNVGIDNLTESSSGMASNSRSILEGESNEPYTIPD